MQFSANALNASQDPLPMDVTAPPKSAGFGRVIVVAAVLIAAVCALHFTPINAYLSDVQRLREKVLAIGAPIYPLAILIVAVILACGVPRLAVHVAGGAVFGFGVGLLLTLVGAVLGHYGVFLFIRWGGRDWVLSRWPRLRKWADVMHEHGVAGVLLFRQLPLHAMIVNLCLALSHVKHRQFLIGTAIGLLPEGIPATLVGAGLMKSSLKDCAGYLVAAAIVFAAIWIVSGYAFRKMRRRQRAFPA